MAEAKRRAKARTGRTAEMEPTVAGILAALKQQGSKTNVQGMARYGIVAPKAFGVSVATLRAMARQLGQNHALALELWDTGWYEARMLASFLADSDAISAADMDRWTRDFDNWAITDTVCFSLFDRTPHAWRKVDEWTRSDDEFVKRAGFALLASLALHDNHGPDGEYSKRLKLITTHAADERNFVKKALSWALHAVGSRSVSLHEAAIEVATALAASEDRSRRWIGRDALRKLTSAPTRQRLNRRTAATAKSRK